MSNNPKGAGRKKVLNEEMVLYMKNQGATHQEIADYFGVSLPTVTRTLSKYKGQYLTQKAGRYDKITLTTEQIKYIKSLSASGYSQRRIANMTGFSNSFIQKTLKNN